MKFNSNDMAWSNAVFGNCNLGDPRRTKRIIDVGARLSKNPSGSFNELCKGDIAAREGTYKMLENPRIRPTEISSGVFRHTADLVQRNRDVLAIQDTTTVSCSPSVSATLQENGSPSGFLVHSTLLIDNESAEPIGLIDQKRWVREKKGIRASVADRKERPYETKESYKWAEAVLNTRKRLGEMSNVITVCDREGDIFELLKLHIDDKLRFVIRQSFNRAVVEHKGGIEVALANLTPRGQTEIEIGQRGRQIHGYPHQKRSGRTQRTAIAAVSSGAVVLKSPLKGSASTCAPLSLNVVHVAEQNPPAGEDAIVWKLYTSEPVSTFDEAMKVVRIYRRRWLIEEFHKAWKSGCKIEERNLQSVENFERMLVITAPVAVRILQLRAVAHANPETDCSAFLEKQEWQCLWMITQNAPPPDTPPSIEWVYYTVAKMAGWVDSKKTGRVGWETLWKGWRELQNQLVGWRAAMQMMGNFVS